MLHAGVNIHRLTSCTKHFHTMIGLEEWRTCVRAWDAVKGCWFGKTCAAAARRTRLSTAHAEHQHAEHQHAEPVYGEHKLSVSVFTIIVLLLLAVIVSISTVAAGDIEKKPGPNCAVCGVAFSRGYRLFSATDSAATAAAASLKTAGHTVTQRLQPTQLFLDLEAVIGNRMATISSNFICIQYRGDILTAKSRLHI